MSDGHGTVQPIDGNLTPQKAVHRIIEEQASSFGQIPAISSNGVTLSYRELNQRANGIARYLSANGLRRRSLAVVAMPRSLDAAAVLLGILKAGAAYAFVDREKTDGLSWPHGISLNHDASALERKFLAFGGEGVLKRMTNSCANLPVVTRPTDAACAFLDRNGEPIVFVAHATIAALVKSGAARSHQWTQGAGTLDLWIGLLSGATVSVDQRVLRTAA